MRKTILVAEDDFFNRLLAVTLLEAAGYDVAEACDGEEALAAIEAIVPDLVVLDIKMPRMTGMAVLEKLKANDEWLNVPVLAVTAYCSVEDLRNIHSAGATELLCKPVPNDKFLKAASRLVENIH